MSYIRLHNPGLDPHEHGIGNKTCSYTRVFVISWFLYPGPTVSSKDNEIYQENGEIMKPILF